MRKRFEIIIALALTVLCSCSSKETYVIVHQQDPDLNQQMQTYYDLEACGETIGRFFQVKVEEVYRVIPEGVAPSVEYFAYVLYAAPRTTLPIKLEKVSIKAEGELKDFFEGQGTWSYDGIDTDVPILNLDISGSIFEEYYSWTAQSDLKGFRYVPLIDNYGNATVEKYGYTTDEIAEMMSDLFIEIQYNSGRKEKIPFSCSVMETIVYDGLMSEWQEDHGDLIYGEHRALFRSLAE